MEKDNVTEGAESENSIAVSQNPDSHRSSGTGEMTTEAPKMAEHEEPRESQQDTTHSDLSMCVDPPDVHDQVNYFKLYQLEEAQRQRTTEYNVQEASQESPEERQGDRSRPNKIIRKEKSSYQSPSQKTPAKGKYVKSSSRATRSKSQSQTKPRYTTVYQSTVQGPDSSDEDNGAVYSKTVSISHSAGVEDSTLLNISSENDISESKSTEEENHSTKQKRKTAVTSSKSSRKKKSGATCLDVGDDSPPAKIRRYLAKSPAKIPTKGKTPSSRSHTSPSPTKRVNSSTTVRATTESPNRSASPTSKSQKKGRRSNTKETAVNTPTKSPRRSENPVTPSRNKTPASTNCSPTKKSPKKKASFASPSKSPKSAKRSAAMYSSGSEDENPVNYGPMLISQLHNMRDMNELTRPISGRIQELTQSAKTDKIAPSVRRRMVLVDNSSMIIAYVYDKHFSFINGDTISVTNCKLTNGRLTIHTDSKVRLTKKLHISEADKLKAAKLIVKPMNDYTLIKHLKKIPVKPHIYYSIQGMVLSASGRKEVPVSESKMAWCNADGSGSFPAESGRYHLYLSLACPFAHRALTTRALKGLQDVISITVVGPDHSARGWDFTDKFENCTLDTVNGCETLKQVYQIADPNYSGRVTVPLLWDKKTKTAVNNDSGELLRMFNSSFNAFCPTEAQRQLDLCPETLRTQIDEINSWVGPNINLGVYHCGLMAKSQEDYDTAIVKLYDHLDKAEEILGRQRYLAGNTFTEADVRLFTTLMRFDWVYHTHFKCNKKMVHEYKNLWGFLREIYQMSGVADTVDKKYIIYSYFKSHPQLNPSGIVPVGADLDLTGPHGRDQLPAQ